MKSLENIVMVSPCAWASVLHLVPNGQRFIFLSSQYNKEITHIQQKAKERETRHHEELAMMRVKMNEIINKNSEFFINILLRAGIYVLDNTPW